MKCKATGKASCKGISNREVMGIFPDSFAPKRRFNEKCWSKGVHFQHCESVDFISGAKGRVIYRCQETENCERNFVKIGTVTQSLNFENPTWAIARIAVMKAVITGLNDRDTNCVSVKIVPSAGAAVLLGFVFGPEELGVKLRTDEHGGCRGPIRKNETVDRGVSEYVRGMADTQEIESTWSALKRAPKSVFHKARPKQLDRYFTEFARQYRFWDADAPDRIEGVIEGIAENCLSYYDLAYFSGLHLGVRT